MQELLESYVKNFDYIQDGSAIQSKDYDKVCPKPV